MRNESNEIVAAVKETINVGRQAGVRVDISHHKMLGKPNWGKQKETLGLIHEARAEGIQVICDQYPYTCNMTTLNACMPPWYFENGFSSMTEKLKDQEFRKKLRAEMEDPNTPYDLSLIHIYAGGSGKSFPKTVSSGSGGVYQRNYEGRLFRMAGRTGAFRKGAGCIYYFGRGF